MFFIKQIYLFKGLTIFLLVFLVSSCCKFTKDDSNKAHYCKDFEGYHKFIYEPIVLSEECNCIVMGKVKYFKNCETQVLIDYGDGTCDNIATKIICNQGNCFDENKEPIEIHNFTIDCNGNEIVNGPLTNEEISILNNNPNFEP
jgi:hypothetical protein